MCTAYAGRSLSNLKTIIPLSWPRDKNKKSKAKQNPTKHYPIFLIIAPNKSPYYAASIRLV